MGIFIKSSVEGNGQLLDYYHPVESNAHRVCRECACYGVEEMSDGLGKCRELTSECAKACEIGGFEFEVGDMIATDTWSMHMDGKMWGKDAKWLEESNRPRAAFQSFGEGP
ncbi:hypothetical protein PRIPAC_95701 [Pristionchus pacificus]|uniref:Uncharacterized protein n=1 Tax=Pristionchus pacificus TaxID=54126 RepID=A0A2A6D2Z6_PRIPA|nr:hypothetical protein PRIPAC_95701 [Pristionchus pacificus]|eukprot:PDM84740.1 hypothetical protein PRIPAC_33763 [Pristionchus pacificus]